MHGESPRAVEPLRVAGPAVELEERVAVAGRAMAEAASLLERTGLPDQLASRREHRVEAPVESRRHRGQPDDDPGRSVAPLDEPLGPARLARDGRPIR